MSLLVAGGSVTGAAHVLAGRSNQDAFAWARVGSALVAVVCDGCGGAPRSEVGATVGARLFVASLARRLGDALPVAALVEKAREETAAHLRVLAEAMSAPVPEGPSPASSRALYAKTVTDHFLFTVVGVVIDDDAATTFSLGDGLVVHNGRRRVLGPFPENEPPYLGYDLLRGAPAARPFEIHEPIPRTDLDALLLGTDGAVELDAMSERPLDGRDERVGALEQFWREDRFFANPDMVRRRLAVIHRGPRGGLLPDDTTVVVVRHERGGAS